MKFDLKIDEIKYINILYKHSSGEYQVLKTIVKSINEREIVVCAKASDNNELLISQEVVLNIAYKDGLYKSNTRVKSSDNALPYVFYALETPKETEYQQNREFFRVPLNYTCNYIVSTKEGIRSYRTSSFDISANGISLLLLTKDVPAKEGKIEILFSDRTISVRVKYIRCERVNNEYKLCFTFTEISNSDRDYISQICIKKQLEQRRLSLQKF